MSTISFKNRLEAYFNSSESELLDGLSYSSDSLFLNSIGKSKKIIITKDNLSAKRIYNELYFLSKESSKSIILIPGTEEMPYDMVDSDKFLSSSKNYNLFKYIKNNQKNITVITTVKNFSKKLLSKKTLKDNTLIIKKNSSFISI